MIETNSDNPELKLFREHLRDALNALYDPRFLRKSPLVGLFGLSDGIDPVSSVRRTLTGAIESLKPRADTPSDSRTWRVYHILRRRYVEQITQREVASELSLGVRQLQREEKLAREVLADCLWRTYNLEDKVGLLQSNDGDAADESSAGQALTRSQEIAWLKESLQPEATDIDTLLHDVIETVQPLLDSSDVSITCPDAEGPCRTALQQALLRQALLDILTSAIPCVPGGRIHIGRQISDCQLCIIVRIEPGTPSSAAAMKPLEGLETASELVRLCGGELRVARPEVDSEMVCNPEWASQGIDQRLLGVAAVMLPIAQQPTILFIDDNADALRLFQRYLSRTRFDFMGEEDPQRGVTMAAELHPHIIVLDVMMPEHDGWRVLSDLKNRPEIQDVPVIICSILSQRDLALARGAAGFIRKPVSRQELLDVLERTSARLSSETG